MSDTPFKLRVARALTDALKTITPANGFAVDMSDYDRDGVETARVYRGRMWFGESDPLPMLSILEPDEAPDYFAEEPDGSDGSGCYDWAINVQGFVRDDPNNPTDPAYVLLADVRQKLAREAERRTADHDPEIFGLSYDGSNRIEKLRFGTGTVRPADDVSAFAWFWLPVWIRISEDASAPYSD